MPVRITSLPRRNQTVVDSTMLWARREVGGVNFPHGGVFSADHQTHGRGRFPDRIWHDRAGESLLVTVAVPSNTRSPREPGVISLEAGLAVAGVVDTAGCRERAEIKWPNDVLLGGKKVGGVLLERTAEWLFVGIGINVLQSSFDGPLWTRATSLTLSGASAIAPQSLLPLLLARLEESFACDDWRSAVEGCLAWRGKRCRFSSSSLPGEAEGVVAGIAGDGALVVTSLRLDSGGGHADLPDPWLCYSGEILPAGWNE